MVGKTNKKTVRNGPHSKVKTPTYEKQPSRNLPGPELPEYFVISVICVASLPGLEVLFLSFVVALCPSNKAALVMSGQPPLILWEFYCWYLKPRLYSLFLHRVLVDLSVSMMMH